MGHYDYRDHIHEERLYLPENRDPRIMNRINYLKNNRISVREFNMNYYSDAFHHYDEFIELAAQVIKELNVDEHSILTSMIIHRMIFDGFFSIDNTFSGYREGVTLLHDLPYYEGIDIVFGHGCCRHYVYFYDDIFKKLNLTDHIYPCLLSEDSYSLEEGFTKPANHALNMIEYDGTLYGYDCHTDLILKVKNAFSLVRILPDDEKEKNKLMYVVCYYKPYFDVILNGIELDDVYVQLKEYMNHSKKDSISYEQFRNFRYHADDIFHSNRRLFDIFKSDTKVLKKQISIDIDAGLRRIVADHYY